MALLIIEEHPNYCVDPYGNVYRIEKDNSIRRLIPDYSTGYARVDLDGKKESVGRLVYKTFRPEEWEESKKIFHINGDNTYDDINNLALLTPSEIELYSSFTPDFRTRSLFSV